MKPWIKREAKEIARLTWQYAKFGFWFTVIVMSLLFCIVCIERILK